MRAGATCASNEQLFLSGLYCCIVVLLSSTSMLNLFKDYLFAFIDCYLEIIRLLIYQHRGVRPQGHTLGYAPAVQCDAGMGATPA